MHRPALLILIAACLLLLVESTVLMRTRWVEDESWLSNGSWTLVQEGRLRMPIFPADPRFAADVGPPLHHLGMAASFAAFGLGIPQARGVSALAGIATVIVVFLLALDLGGPWCAALAALLVASDNFLAIASRTARAETMTTFLCWLAVLLYFRAIRRQSLILSLGSGLACGLALTCHPLGFPFLCCLGLFFCMHYGMTVWRQPMVWIFIVAAMVPVAAYAAWCFSDPAHIAGFRDAYLSKAGNPLRERIVGELDRWSDFIGLSSRRVLLPVRVPLRIHLAFIQLAAFVYLFRARRKLAIPMVILLAANLAWFVYMVNKGPRYLVLLSPLFAIVLGWVLVELLNRRARLLAGGTLAVVLLTQLAGNAYFIYQYRTADYPAVARQLRAIIPPGASVWGITTMWMALHDRTYYAYDRTPLDFAVQKLKPEYLILYDRVMVNGSGHGEDDFAKLRTQATELVRRQGTLAGRVSNEFYGAMEIYRITY